jgi:hypothetical protein
MIRKRGGSYGVKVWNPATGKDEWIGSRRNLKDARKIEREAEQRFARSNTTEILVGDYGKRWLDVKHGPGTRRPQVTTRIHNENAIKPFLETFADRRMNSFLRREALDWSAAHPHNAKAVSAMFNDAVDDEYVESNPFANRRVKKSRGRRDISPLTLVEVNRLGDIALDVWGPYGATCRAWVLCAAWVGWRPGEGFAARHEDADMDAGTINVKRQVQVDGERDPKTGKRWNIILPGPAERAIRDMGTIRTGLLFHGIQGKQIRKGAYTWYWDRVRTVFEAELEPERRAQLLNGRPNLDLYELRHFCASMLRARGASYDDIAFQLGNSARVCEETYCHLYAGETTKRLADLFDGADRALQASLAEAS